MIYKEYRKNIVSCYIVKKKTVSKLSRFQKKMWNAFFPLPFSYSFFFSFSFLVCVKYRILILNQVSSNRGTCGTIKPHKNKENKRKFWQIWHIVLNECAKLYDHFKPCTDLYDVCVEKKIDKF